jgi:hypothetical protein
MMLKSNRAQYVEFNDNTTDRLLVNCGVPQGPVLGPLLFIIQFLKPVIFADDTTLYTSLDFNRSENIDKINGELHSIIYLAETK